MKMVPVSNNMTHAGKVSIVIPCYNHGATLRETLASVESVRNANLLEVIVVNDGSTEPKTLELFAELDSSNYTVLHQPNSGLGAARNAGIRLARGEFILPLDGDNRIRSAYLTSGVQWLQQHPAVAIVYGNAEYFGQKTGVWQVPAFNLLELSKMNFIDACALYRKTVWESIGGYDEKMPWMGWEDWDFWLRAAADGWDFSHLEETAFDYRVQSGSMIGETNRHADELLAHIFGKPQNRLFKILRELNADSEKLRQIEKSRDYQLGRVILAPLRQLKRCFRQARI
jgi:glycosyltransferase involved in cell wall biosynthesis